MKKNGFLSVSTVFAFFLVFLSLMLYIILNMSNNRFLLNKMKDTIKSDLIEEEEKLADWVISQYTGTQGENNLYYHNSTLENSAQDNSYRYAGLSSTTNNFVCFASDAPTCPDNNLYRIIGVFNGQVKLIKWDYATMELLGTDGGYGNTYLDTGNNGTNKGSNATSEIGGYYWNSSGTNTWTASTLNLTNLNINFLKNIGADWKDLIAETTWKVRGNTSANIINTTVSNTYKNEYTSPATNETYNGKIGLMYVSDYGYATSPNSWTKNLSSYNGDGVTLANWMYMGLNEWTILRKSDDSKFAFYVSSDGNVDANNISTTKFAVRPVFYLNEDVTRTSGSGTKTDPIRLG